MRIYPLLRHGMKVMSRREMHTIHWLPCLALSYPTYLTFLSYPYFDGLMYYSHIRRRSGSWSEWCKEGRRWMEEGSCCWMGQAAEGYSLSCSLTWTSSTWWEEMTIDWIRNKYERSSVAELLSSLSTGQLFSCCPINNSIILFVVSSSVSR